MMAIGGDRRIILLKKPHSTVADPAPPDRLHAGSGWWATASTSTRRAVLPFRLLFYSVKLICVLNWMPGVLACSFLTLASSLMAWR